MARKCKCKICKKELTTDVAYKVIANNKNVYYCNEEEYQNELKEKQQKDNCYNTIKSILNEPFVTPMMKKEISKLKGFYSYIVIEKTFKECEENIKWFLNNKEYNTEYAKIRYIITIIQNNINTTYKKHIQDIKKMENLFKKSNNNIIDVDLINNANENNLNNNNNNDISEFLD